MEPAQEITASPKKHRRRWSDHQKTEILASAKILGISGAARHYGIAPSLLFAWAKDLRAGNAAHTIEDITQPGCYRNALARIDELAEQLKYAGSKLLEALQTGQATPYSSTIGLSSIAAALDKIMKLRFDTMDKLKNAIASEDAMLKEKQTEESSEIDYSYEVEREAERMLLHIVKSRLIPEQAQQNIDEAAKVY